MGWVDMHLPLQLLAQSLGLPPGYTPGHVVRCVRSRPGTFRRTNTNTIRHRERTRRQDIATSHGGHARHGYEALLTAPW
jgi:hypothetical protein